MIYVLLYSGGIDSVLCLKLLREQGIIPYIFHFKTWKLIRKHEHMIRKTARLLSPESPFYVFETKTENYKALWGRGEYHVFLDNNGRTLRPLDYGDKVVIGYTGYDSNDGRRRLQTQVLTIKESEFYDYPYVFPLANMRKSQILQMFMDLPKEVRVNTVSSTRFKDKGEWTVVFVKPRTLGG